MNNNKFLMNPLSKVLNLLGLLGTLLLTKCSFIYYEALPRSINYYQCIRPTTGSQIILQFQYVNSYVKPDMLENVKNATLAGLNPQLIIQPARCRKVEDELKFLREVLKEFTIDRYWVTFLTDFGPYSPCYWSDYSPEENCQYLQ